MAAHNDPTHHTSIGHVYAGNLLSIAIDSSAAFYPGCTRIIQCCTMHLTLPPHPVLDRTVDLATSHRRLFKDCMIFLTTPRTWEELPSLAQQLAQCRCASGPFAALRWTKEFVYMHDQFTVKGIPTDFRNLLDVVKALARTVLPRLAATAQSRGKLYKVERNRRRDEKRGRSPMFPATPDDVLPFGAQTSMNSLFNWYRWCNHQPQTCAPSIAGLITEIIIILRHSVVPAVVSSKTLLDTLHYVVPLRSERLRAAKPERFDFRDLHEASRILLALALVMPPLLLARWSLLNNGALYTMNMETAVIILAHKAADPIVTASGETIHLAPTLSHFRLFHKRLTIGMRRDGELTPIFPLLYQHNVLGAWTQHCDEEVDISSPYAEAPWKVLSLLISQRCFAPGCVRSFCSERRKFAQCGACRLVFYCSLDCQREAFRHPVAPHKRVCRYLGLIAEVNGWKCEGFKCDQVDQETMGQVTSIVQDIVPLKACCMILAYDDYIQAAYAQAVGKPYSVTLI
jgi:hypothetical protein